MPGTVTETIEKYNKRKGLYDTIVANFAFVADSSNGSIPATAFSATLLGLVKGYFLVVMITIPDGITPPDDQYDITLIGGTTGLDLLGGVGANRSDTNAEQVIPKIGTTEVKRLINETPTLTFAGNTTNSAEGTVQLIFIRDF